MISDDTIISEKNVAYVMNKTVGHIEVEYLEATGTQYIEQDKPANLATVSRFFEYEKKDLYLDKPLSISDLKYFCDKNSANQNPYSNYIQLEYVEADGHQWINTEFIPNQDTRVIMQCNMTSTTTAPFFGSRDRQRGTKTFVLWKINDNFRFDYGSNEYSISVKSSGNRFIYANGYGNTLVVDQLTTNIGNYTFSGEYPLYIFANIDDDGLDSRHPSGKIYLCHIYSGKGTNYMKRRFIPAKRTSDGVSGLLDILNCKFYESLGEPWIAGPEIGPMPNFSLKDYDFLETADSSNDTYLDTGFIPNQDTRLVMEIKKIANTETYHQFIFCSRNSPKPSYGIIKVQNSNIWRDDYANSSVNVSNALNGGASLTQRMLIDKNKNYTNMGNCGVSHTYTNFTLNNTLVLYGAHQKNSELLMDIDMSLYWCRIYDNGVLIRNYYPAQRKTDNAVGLYDFVNSTFTLPVSGTLTAGTVIPKYINEEV